MKERTANGTGLARTWHVVVNVAHIVCVEPSMDVRNYWKTRIHLLSKETIYTHDEFESVVKRITGA